MAESLRPVALVGGARIPFARSNTAYVEAGNHDLLVAEFLILRPGVGEMLQKTVG